MLSTSTNPGFLHNPPQDSQDNKPHNIAKSTGCDHSLSSYLSYTISLHFFTHMIESNKSQLQLKMIPTSSFTRLADQAKPGVNTSNVKPPPPAFLKAGLVPLIAKLRHLIRIPYLISTIQITNSTAWQNLKIQDSSDFQRISVIRARKHERHKERYFQQLKASRLAQILAVARFFDLLVYYKAISSLFGMYSLSPSLRLIALFPLFSSLALATTGQIPLTASPTPMTTSTITTSSTSPSLPEISYTTTIALPDLNLHISAEQLDDPELENIISSLLPKEMFTLLVNATARSVSAAPSPSSPSENDEEGGEGVEEETVMSIVQEEEVLETKTEGSVSATTSLSMKGKAWNGVVAAETKVEVKEGRFGL
ncbi:uncharacterized protein RAG0_08973 [Rhynchosporium agropyri]|uniref:Uncharacterized protein n=1 Tax=Rhynchosporium agropyri TaxID=914238 RepID=A0A1E1KTA4_9HELO|nr:uncharacterized protein RAG0_08973 [Rhynchosporium agropyri]